MKPSHLKKVVVVGAGAVGATFAYALAQTGLANVIVLVDKNTELAQGQALDLAHGEPFFPTVSIRAGNALDYADADLIVITAGTAQRPGETRLDLLNRNAMIVRGIVGDVVENNSDSAILVVTNPVDVMTHVAIQSAGKAKGQVFGSGTVLDSARFRYLLSEYCKVDVHNVHAYIFGEHGDSEFAAWSMTNVAGMPIEQFHSISSDERKRIEQEVRDAAYRIINSKGATNFAVGLALVKISSAVLRGENCVLTVSTVLEGEFGLNDVCLSVPCMVSSEGVERVMDCHLSDEEIGSLNASAQVLKAAVSQLNTSQ